MAKPATQQHSAARSPVIVVMGHIDHGKTTLLDFIRKSNVVAKESGGITQHTSAYEFEHKDAKGAVRRITFLDTPGHEAFGTMRERGAHVADIAILVVSAEDGVKPQTLDAYRAIKSAGIPFVVAINKIDKPGANVEQAKQTLAENEIYVEGYGGDISWAPISAKTGKGVNDLVDILFLVADMADLKGDAAKSGTGTIIEAHMDAKKGATATLIVTDGTIAQGSVAVAENAMTPVRIMEDFAGKPIKSATFSSPIRIMGWNKIPAVGAVVRVYPNKKDAEHAVDEWNANKKTSQKTPDDIVASADIAVIPLILKSDVTGTLEGVEHELAKLPQERVKLRVVAKSVGTITENDVKLVTGATHPIIIGFNVKADARATDVAERHGVTIRTFSVIYEMSDWLKTEMLARTPRREVEQITGQIRILRIFSQQKERQVIGGKVNQGFIKAGDRFKIIRREADVGEGKVIELQQQKIATKEVTEGNEFGAMVESKIAIAERDILQPVIKVTE